MPTKIKSIFFINILFAYTVTPTAIFKSQCFNCKGIIKTIINNISLNDKETSLFILSTDNILHGLYIYVYNLSSQTLLLDSAELFI